MPVVGVSRFQRFFRAAGSIDVDRNDIRRFNGFLEQKLYDLLVVAEAGARANGRDVIEPRDLPITKGLEESVYTFRWLDEELEVGPILAALAVWPPLDLTLSDDTRECLPGVLGGLGLTLARTFKIIDPTLRNPRPYDWERAFRLFALLL